jgi:hypothetical protein
MPNSTILKFRPTADIVPLEAIPTIYVLNPSRGSGNMVGAQTGDMAVTLGPLNLWS